MLDLSNVISVVLVTFTIVELGLIPFVDHNRDFATQRISESRELSQICAQDDDVALRRVAPLPVKE